MKIKTSELTGATLDWAVAQCQGIKLYRSKNKGWMTANYGEFNPRYGAPWYRASSSWEQGGPIIERERIAINCWDFHSMPWVAWMSDGYRSEENQEYGDTPLIAAMRCYVASKLGDEVEIPEELTA